MREKEYDLVWWHVIKECDRLQFNAGSLPDLAPFERLLAQLDVWNRLEWLVEIRDSFREDVELRRDTPFRERRSELWLVEALLCLSGTAPDRARAMDLLKELCQPPLRSCGIGGVAHNLMERVRDHLRYKKEILQKKQTEMLENARPVIVELAQRKPAIRRNLQFAVWMDDHKLKPAAIRDRWNAAESRKPIPKKTKGIGIVKKGIAAARQFLKQLADRGYPLTAIQALQRLPKQKE